MRHFHKRLGNATRGLKTAFKEEPNVRIHTMAALVALALGWWLSISPMEWIVLIIVIALVFILEIVNSIFERVADMVKPGLNEYIRDIKDMMAASVLSAAIVAVIVGAIIFIPKLVEML